LAGAGVSSFVAQTSVRHSGAGSVHHHRQFGETRALGDQQAKETRSTCAKRETHGGLAPPIGTTPPNFNPGIGNGGLTQDFFSPSQCAQAIAGSPIVGQCGYLYQYLPNGSRFPAEHDVFTADQQVYSAYVQDDVIFSERWKSELGLRLDGYNELFPDDPSNPPSVPRV